MTSEAAVIKPRQEFRTKGPESKILGRVQEVKKEAQRLTREGKAWFAKMRGETQEKPRKVIETVQEAPKLKERLVETTTQQTPEKQDTQKTQPTVVETVDVKVEPEEITRAETKAKSEKSLEEDGVYSKEFLPPEVRIKIDQELQRYSKIQEELSALLIEFKSKKIQEVVRLAAESEDSLSQESFDLSECYSRLRDVSMKRKFYKGCRLNALGLTREEIGERRDSLPYGHGVYKFDSGAWRCDELLLAEAQKSAIEAQCYQALGEKKNVIPIETLRSDLRRKIEQEQEYVNGESIMSHVTGCRALIGILKNKRLQARSLQAETGKGEVVTSFTEKGRLEEDQIVFDRHGIRPEYARGKDIEGKDRSDPIIIMMRDRDLMTEYQFFESDGFHFFGKNHNQIDKQKDPFSAEAKKQNMCILVPEIYREDLAHNLTEIVAVQGESFQEVMDDLGVVFVSKDQYTRSEGWMFSGQGRSGSEDERMVEALFELGRSQLFDGSDEKIDGRVVPTGNVGELAGGGLADLYSFQVARSETN